MRTSLPEICRRSFASFMLRVTGGRNRRLISKKGQYLDALVTQIEPRRASIPTIKANWAFTTLTIANNASGTESTVYYAENTIAPGTGGSDQYVDL